MPHLSIETVIAVIIAYLFGSISTAIVTCKLMGLPDPRKQGSGNPGATNVLRFGGKKAAVITLLGDLLKGLIPVLAAKLYGLDPAGLAMVAFAAFLGHLFPIFFRFQGGKGVATAFGCLLALCWQAALALAATWLIIAILFRYSSLAAVLSALTAPLWFWHFSNPTYTTAVGVVACFLIYRHRKNIQNLLNGKESKIGAKK